MLSQFVAGQILVKNGQILVKFWSNLAEHEQPVDGLVAEYQDLERGGGCWSNAGQIPVKYAILHRAKPTVQRRLKKSV